MTTANNGSCFLTEIETGNSSKSMISIGSAITINGNVSFINMKSSWEYFRQISCIADDLTVSGEIAFTVADSYDLRVYIINLTYSGYFNAVPEPTYLRTDYVKNQINNYLDSNYISPLEVILTPVGAFWVILNLICLFILLKRIKY
jgi:hypothetical protein